MEKKYIEVNELLKSFTPDCIVYNSNKPIRIDLRLIKRIITRQPIVDVAEVKHGHWIPHKIMIRTPYAKNYDCSECGNSPIECGAYCNKCGAKMDGGNVK